MLARKELEEIIPIKWPEVVQRRINEIEELHKADANKELIHALKNELDGGTCYKCDKEWQEKFFDKRFGKGRYSEPNCECYPICPWCKRKLYDDFLSGRMRVDENGKLYCDHCGWLLSDGDEARWGADWVSRIDNTMKKDYRQKARGRIGAGLWKQGKKKTRRMQ